MRILLVLPCEERFRNENVLRRGDLNVLVAAVGRLDDGAERLDSRAVIGEAVAALGSRGERTAEQVLAEYLRGLHRGKRVAGDIGGDIAILDALDAVLDRNDRRGSAVPPQ